MRTRVFSADEATTFAVPLWREAFGDSEEDILRILSCVDRVYAAFSADADPEEGGVQSAANAENFEYLGMACAFDVCLGGKAGQYLYAVCTAEKHRKKGVMRRVIDLALKEGKRLGQGFSFLIPEREEYFPMYETLGFTHVVPGLVGVTDGCRYTLRDGPWHFPFDGDLDSLYEIYLATSENTVVKNKSLFCLSLEGLEIAYLGDAGSYHPSGYVIFERNGKDFLNILEIRAISNGNSGIINRELRPLLPQNVREACPARKKALFCLSEELSLPYVADLFLEL